MNCTMFINPCTCSQISTISNARMPACSQQCTGKVLKGTFEHACNSHCCLKDKYGGRAALQPYTGSRTALRKAPGCSQVWQTAGWQTRSSLHHFAPSQLPSPPTQAQHCESGLAADNVVGVDQVLKTPGFPPRVLPHKHSAGASATI